MRQGQELDLKPLRKLVAQQFPIEGSGDQAEFINELGSWWWRLIPRHMDAESQMCFLVNELDENGKKFIRELHAFVLLDDEAKKGAKP